MLRKPPTDERALTKANGKQSRRGLLALLGAGGAAAIAAVLGRDGPAEAAHDATNVLHVGEDNSAALGEATWLYGNVADAVLAAANSNPGTPDLPPAGVVGVASTSLLIPLSGQRGAAQLRDRLRDLRFFMKKSPLADGIGTQGVVGDGIGVFGGGDSIGVQGGGMIGVAGIGDFFGVFGASFGAGVVGASDAGPGVAGSSESGPGVEGLSNTGPGVRGEGKTGVRGHASGQGKVGVHATAGNRAVALKVEGGPMILPKLSTAQRNAVPAVNGMLIYNTTVQRVQARVNGHWVNL